MNRPFIEYMKAHHLKAALKHLGLKTKPSVLSNTAQQSFGFTLDAYERIQYDEDNESGALLVSGYVSYEAPSKKQRTAVAV